jgi:hypothetical protein
MWYGSHGQVVDSSLGSAIDRRIPLLMLWKLCHHLFLKPRLDSGALFGLNFEVRYIPAGIKKAASDHISRSRIP